MVLVKAIYKTNIVSELSTLIAKAKHSTQELIYVEVTPTENADLMESGQLTLVHCERTFSDRRFFKGVEIKIEKSKWTVDVASSKSLLGARKESKSIFDNIIQNMDYDSEQLINKIDVVKVNHSL
jgi:hypothetical protein